MKRKYQYLYETTKILDRADGNMVVYGEYRGGGETVNIG
jgi:hypothetical protein